MFSRLFAVVFFSTALVTSQPAAAYTPLTVTSVYCEALGYNRAFCEATVTGGAGGYIYNWTRQQIGTTIIVTYPPSTSNLLMHGCSSPYAYSIKVTVTDSAGATASGQGSYNCLRNPQ